MNRENEVFLPPITKIQCIIGTNNGPCDLVFVSMPTLNKTISGLFVPAHAVTGTVTSRSLKAYSD